MHINLYFSQNVLGGISGNAAGSFTGYLMSKYQGKKIQDMIKGDPPPHTHTHFKETEQVQEPTMAGSWNDQTRNLRQL